MYYYIINPASGLGKINKIQDKLKETLHSLGIDGEFVKTTGPGDAARLVNMGLEKGYKTIIAVGGDETVNEIINALAAKKSDAVLGVIPIGQENNLAKMLGISDWQDAAKIIASRKLEDLDLGKIKLAQRDYFFVTTANVGFETKLIGKREQLGRVGKILYYRKLISQLLSYRPNEFLIIFDDKFEVRGKFFNVACYNVKLGTSKLKTNPKDEKFDVLVVPKQSARNLIFAAKAILKGEYDLLSDVSVFRAKKVKIESEKEAKVSVDGQILGKTPAELWVTKEKLKAIVGKERKF